MNFEMSKLMMDEVSVVNISKMWKWSICVGKYMKGSQNLKDRWKLTYIGLLIRQEEHWRDKCIALLN